MKTRIGRLGLVAALFASLAVGAREVRASNTREDCTDFLFTACAMGGDDLCRICCIQEDGASDGQCSNPPGQVCLCIGR